MRSAMKTIIQQAVLGAVLIAALPLLVPVARAAAKPAVAKAVKVAKPVPLPIPKARSVVTHHSVVIDGQRIDYTATAGTLLLYDAKHQATASVFYIAYTKDGVRDPARRPITFAYNGGPGFASALVDVGGFGPRRLVWPAPGDAKAAQPPYQLIPNADSILKSTDLVFIDAVGTGYSRIVGYGTPKMFYGINGDAHAFSQFIQRYVQQSGRFQSPKFLLGESYGTTRSAVLARDLVGKGVYLDGVILCSTVLDFATLNTNPGNDLPYELYLPSYAAVAWYHHRLHPQPPDLPAFVHQVEQFAGGAYAHALFQGAALPAAEKAHIAAQLARYTGLPVALWLRADLRMPLSVFQRNLLGDGYSTGRFDARFTTPELQPLDPESGGSAAGAATTAIWGALSARFDDYLWNSLHYRSRHLYVQTSGTVFKAWDWGRYTPPLSALAQGVGSGKTLGRVRNVAPALARAMSNDPAMQLLLNNGWFDLATPFDATNYTIAHMGLPQALQGNIHEDYYKVGHMLYLNPAVLPQLAHNIDAFITHAAARG
jgi:carboxypeptidase C (cathepsin A)